MIGFIAYFFTIPINYSAITNLKNSLGHAPFSSLYTQLPLSSELTSRITFARTQRKTQSVFLMKLVYSAVA
jgi:hypothetical protein